MENQNLDQNHSFIHNVGVCTEDQEEQQDYVTREEFDAKNKKMEEYITSILKLFGEMKTKQTTLSQQILKINNDITKINNNIQAILTELDKKLELNANTYKNTIDNIYQEINKTNINLNNNYYKSNIIEQKFGSIDNKFSNHYNQINQKVITIENNIKVLMNKLQKLDVIEQQIKDLAKQGANNQHLINDYFNNITEMISLTQKTFKLYNKNEIVEKPEKIFEFLFNSMMGLQLERKRDALRAKMEKQHNKDSYNLINNNIDINNNININYIKEKEDIKKKDIEKRLKQQCEDLNMQYSNEVLAQMVEFCFGIITNEQQQNKQSPNEMMTENIKNNKLKQIQKCLLMKNPPKKNKNNIFDIKAQEIDNNEIKQLILNAQKDF